MTGSADGPAVHYGLLGIADDLVLSALDDRLLRGIFRVVVAGSGVGTSGMADRLGDRSTRPLTWVDQPTTMESAEQVLALFPARPDPVHTDSGNGSCPASSTERDWTIRPLTVPDDATAAVAIHQPGSGRIWIGTAPDGGDVGLAYTDDGGASWTDVELPEPLRPTSEELMSGDPEEINC